MLFVCTGGHNSSSLGRQKGPCIHDQAALHQRSRLQGALHHPATSDISMFEAPPRSEVAFVATLLLSSGSSHHKARVQQT